MPKGRKKRRDRGATAGDSVSPDEDSESVCSSQDGGGSVMSEDGVGVVNGGVEEEILEVDIEFQLGEYIDQLSDKNSRTRLDALVSLNKVLSYKMVAHHLLGRKETLVDIIIRNLRRVQGRERCELLQLCTLLVVQFGTEHPDVSTGLKPTITQLAQDHTVAVQERAKCVILLGVIGFIGAADLYEVEQTLRFCEDLFKKSKRDEIMVASCAQSWSLLLSVAPNHIIPGLFQSLLPVFNTLLDKLEGGGASSTARLAIGQAVAILFELGREVDSDLLESGESSETYSLIEQLATESNRYTARKERNQLRAHFRDVLQTLNDEGAPERTVKVGLESISLDSWSRLIQYNMFRELLGSGMTAHIQGNELLREVFQMGPAPLTTVESKASRLERKYYNAAVAKHRTQSRAKQRDKRTVL